MNLTVSNNRLLRLASFLRTLPRKRFNYVTWVGNEWEGENLNACGTSACALGWATTIPSLRRAGLILQKNKRHNGGFITLKQDEDAGPIQAGATVFGITIEEAKYLFIPTGAIEDKATPKRVAKKIETFVANRKKD